MKKKAIINFTASILYQVVSLLVGLILPKYYTEIFGSAYNGLNQTITQIISLLSVLQFGISAASIQQIFKHIADNDQDSIAAVYQNTAQQYRNMGYIFIVAVIPIAVLYPMLLRNELPYTIIVAFLLMRAFSSAMEYFFQAKYSVILIADNKSYLIYYINTALLVFSSVLHALALLTRQNILVYQAVAVVSAVVRLIVISTYIRKKYPYLRKKTFKIDKEDNRCKRKDVLISEIAGLIIDSTDLVVLSTFSGLILTSIYSVYNFVVSGLGNVLGSCREAVFAGMGKTYYTNFNDFKRKMNKFMSIYFMVMFYLYSVAIILFKPFVEVYTAKMDVEYLYAGLPILFLLMKLLVNIRIPAIVAINIAGHFRQVRNYAVIEAVINLTVSVVLVINLGIYGVLIGTIAGALYRTPLLICYANRNIMKWSVTVYLKKILIWVPVFISSYLASLLVNFRCDNLGMWLADALICSFVYAIIFLVWIGIFDKVTFGAIKEILRKIKSK